MTQYNNYIQHKEVKEKKNTNWTIWDKKNTQLIYLTNKEFKEGLDNHFIKLRGEYVLFNNMKEKMWIDGYIN